MSTAHGSATLSHRAATHGDLTVPESQPQYGVHDVERFRERRQLERILNEIALGERAGQQSMYKGLEMHAHIRDLAQHRSET